MSTTQSGLSLSITRSEMIFWIVLCVCLAAILVAFDFYPLNDEWDTQQTVQRWADNGELKYSNWIAVSFLWQALWGRAFVLFGFSSLALVVSTVTAGMLACLFFRFLLGAYGVPTRVALFGTACLLFNPYVFVLLFTFMSDVHYLAWLLGATLLYHIGLDRGQLRALVGGSLLCALALLVRQNGCFIAAGAVVAVLIGWYMFRSQTRNLIFKQLAAIVAVPLLVFVGFQIYYFKVQQPTTSFSMLRARLMEGHFLSIAPVAGLKILFFLGFATLPLLPLMLAGLARHKRTLFVLPGVLGLLAAGAAWAKLFGYPGTEWEGGSALLVMLGQRPTVLPHSAVVAIGIASLVSVGVLFTASIHRLFSSRSVLSHAVLWIALLQVAFALMMFRPFSRYYVSIIPFAILASLYPSFSGLHLSRKTWGACVLLLAGLIFFTLGMETRLLAQNETRWKAASALLQEGVSPKEIEAGFAWDCWHLFEYSEQHGEEIVPYAGEVPWWIQRMTPVMTPKYVLAMSDRIPDYFGMKAVLESVVGFNKPTLWGPDRFYLFRLQAPPPSAPHWEIDIAHAKHQDQLRNGWWWLEGRGDRHFRWMTRTSTAVLGMVPGRPYVKIRGYAVLRYFESSWLKMIVYIDGQKVGEHILTEEGVFEFLLPLSPEASSKEQILVRISLSDTFRPPGQGRKLGVTIAYIGLAGK